MSWRTVLTDLSGNPYGELRDASSRTWKRILNRPRATSWTARCDNPLAVRMADDDLTLVKVYEDTPGAPVLRLHGPVVTHEKNRDASGGTIAVSAQDAFWRLSHRLVGRSFAGFSMGTALAPADKGAIVAAVLAEANASGDTGVRLGTVALTSQAYAGPWRFKQADQAIVDLATGATGIGGFDWNVEPTEAISDALGVQLGALNVAPIIGAVQPNVVFEFGTGKHNVSSFRDVGDAAALCNQAWALPSNFPDDSTQAILSARDVASIAQRGLHEAIVSADVLVDVLRQALADQAVALRMRPRRVITFEPIAQDPGGTPDELRRMPRMFVDYDVGDIVRFRAVERIRLAAAEPAVSYVGALLTDRPVLLTHLDEAVGATAILDAMGGAAGSYTASGVTLEEPALVPSLASATSAAFDGAAGFGSFADRTALNLGDNFTLEFTVVLESYADARGAPVVIGDKGGGDWIVRVADALDGRLIFRRNGVVTVCTSTVALRLGVAYHVIVTWDGTNDRCTMDVNGTDVAGAVTATTFAASRRSLGLGAADIGFGENGFLHGGLDEFALYNYVLSPGRRAAHHAAWLEQAEATASAYTTVTTIDAYFRVFAVEMAIDDHGMGTPRLALVEDGS